MRTRIVILPVPFQLPLRVVNLCRPFDQESRITPYSRSNDDLAVDPGYQVTSLPVRINHSISQLPTGP